MDLKNLPAGTVLTRKYRVVETLGVGGMGVVVAADDLERGGRVAIKLLLPELVDNDMVVARFLQEAEAARRIQSKHIATVSDVGTMTGDGLPERGIPYLVMEYLEGRDLAAWIKMGKKFPIVDAIDLVVQAAEALARAHQVGIVHRDIKPANLFLCEHGDVKVLDFGISKIMDDGPEEMSLTRTTTVLGSGLYMSPEQMRSAKRVDFRSDIYSLGICLYELLTGTQPHTAETFSELCVTVNIDPPTPIRDYRPDIPEELAEAIAVAYAVKPESRYQTIQDMVAALAPYATSPRAVERVVAIGRREHTPEPRPQRHAVPARATAPSPPLPRRSDSRSSLLVAVALAVVVTGAIFYVLVSRRPPPPTSTATTAQSEAVAPEPSVTAVQSAADTATASSSPKPPPVSRSPRRPPPRPVAPPPAPKPPPKPPAKPPCKERIDESGLIIPCL